MYTGLLRGPSITFSLISLQLWQGVTQLRFLEVENVHHCDMVIFFAAGPHSDNPVDIPFDGPGGVLAHAFIPFKSFADQPGLDGDIHFDKDEFYVVNTDAITPGNDFI